MSLNLDKTTWQPVKFGDVVRNVNQTIKDAVSAGIERVIAMEHMDPGELNIQRWGSVADGTTFTRRVKPGQTLFGKRRAYQRKVAFAEFEAICSGDILTFEADEKKLLPELLPFLVQSDRFFEHALGTSAGSLSPRTNWKDLANFEFDLPPLPEQKRLADLLWAVEEHKQALITQLERMHAVRGNWRNKQIDALFLRSHTTLGDLVEQSEVIFLTGPFGSTLSAKEYVSNGIPVIHPSHIRDGRVTVDPKSTVTQAKADQLSRWKVQVGDVVLMRKGDVGRSAIIAESEKNWILGSDCISIRASRNFLPEYLTLALSTPEAMSTLLRNAPGTTMPGINERSLKPLALPNIAISVQQELLKKDSLFKEAIAGHLDEISGVKVSTVSLLAEIFGGPQ